MNNLVSVVAGERIDFCRKLILNLRMQRKKGGRM